MLNIRAEFRKDDLRTVFNVLFNDYGIDIVLHNLKDINRRCRPSNAHADTPEGRIK